MHAALIALVFVLTSLAGMAHEAATQHVRCAEHGELVDAAGPPALAARDTLLTVASRGAPSEPVHGHDHCAFAQTTRASRLDLRPPGVAPIAVAVVELPAALPPRPVHAGVAVFRAAPKTSPPRAA